METIKEPKQVTANDFRSNRINGQLFDSEHFDVTDTIDSMLEQYAEVKNSETIELYNRQCVRANDLNEENNRLKERVQELEKEYADLKYFLLRVEEVYGDLKFRPLFK